MIKHCCDKCGNSETKEVPVFIMSVLLASVEPIETVINMRIGAPKPNRPTGEVIITKVVGADNKKIGTSVDKKVGGVPLVENWQEIEYSGPPSSICYVASQELCFNCIKSLRNSISEKFTKVIDHGTFSDAINTEDKKPTTIVGNDPITGNPITAEEVTKRKVAVTDAEKYNDPAINPAVVETKPKSKKTEKTEEVETK